ncbi:GGDEF domain-containing protein [Rhizobium sp. 'Codium 1']|uniref:GGDEF domain-containing protein n=1 Tax=Rhizobium sp. 'Codium 1' TaxID=2940484 RepID=UPI001E31D113|nr:GGDEF domain-containing protein [Rhizobium sp. 'Codium 1']MCC8933837.1 GGDEF domain-containing protein [Rhizobium sp. 'Codium 1']
MIDVKTAFFLWVIQANTLAILLIAIWLHARDQKHFLWFGIGFLFHANGLGMVGMRGQIPDFISIQVANTLSLVGFSFWAKGLAALDHRPGSPFFLLPPLLWIVGNFVPSIRDDFAFRVSLYNAGASLGFAILAVIASRARFSTSRDRTLLTLLWGMQVIAGIGHIVVVLHLRPTSFADDFFGMWMGTFVVICFITSAVILAKITMDRSEEQLQALVRTDPLTGALNRRGFSEAYQRLAETSPLDMLGVLVFDLDHFKQINDRYGHTTGDRVLQEFAKVCRSLLPQRAVFARTGGEEFAAILAISEPRDAALFAETVRLAFADRSFPTGEAPISVTTSVGISVSPLHTANLDHLLSEADLALYTAKAQGRNRTSVRAGNRTVTVPPSREESPLEEVDRQADRHVAILNRISAVAHKLND